MKVQDQLRERAREASEECCGSVLGYQLDMALQDDDLPLMKRLLVRVEKHLLFVDTIREDEIK